MKERGMIFNAEMVRAILDGRKTQTRRPFNWKRQPAMEMAERDDGSLWPWAEDCERGGDIWFACPFGEVGDRIWVRETFRVHSRATDVATLVYRASVRNSWTEQTHRVPVVVCDKPATPEKWTPSIHMPRWASRILLEITDVRVERLQGISQRDAIAEGGPSDHPSFSKISREMGFSDWPRSWFAQTWWGIYGREAWDANHWVWVIEFRRIEGGAA
ncbi:TPA: hypothetical protein ACGEPX_004532 [Salmonella enterica]|nr:hypothetical protein [Salmonella enterica subsp. enterica serovar Edinburgh]EBH8904561.1 hypothetical protein [Salmonella enterica subsp. enterica serovar 6,7:b:-]EGY4496583.1 hypothetical protein [Salmonella enterica]EBH8946453.1 hypothetical protein [Salmonella enterica subsp. enterica serovar 6,7:b:-]EJA5741213.1 hypothetical protein [Salmonella enterica]